MLQCAGQGNSASGGLWTGESGATEAADAFLFSLICLPDTHPADSSQPAQPVSVSASLMATMSAAKDGGLTLLATRFGRPIPFPHRRSSTPQHHRPHDPAASSLPRPTKQKKGQDMPQYDDNLRLPGLFYYKSWHKSRGL
jgi:hypothetical protein